MLKPKVVTVRISRILFGFFFLTALISPLVAQAPSSLSPGQRATLENLLSILEELQGQPEAIQELHRSVSGGPSTSALASEDIEFFEKHIRPVLIESCYQCHGAENQKGGLRLDSASGLVAGGSHGTAIVPGDPDKSLLVNALRYLDPNLQMPPSGRLADSILLDFEEWIRRGAPDPRIGLPGPSAATPVPAIDVAEARKFWSFQPLEKPSPPSVRSEEWVRSPIDAFILADLEEAGIPPAPRADKRMLMRRVTFDLTGLPPTPEEMDSFLSDESPEAFSKVVDRLLTSPHYGERWGRHWLDVARYTDSFDSRATVEQDVSEAYKYRDWVVNAFNLDMPYDQFLIHQIAGDMLPSREEGSPSDFNKEGTIATGVLAIGNWPGGDADKEKMVTDIVDDQVDLVTRGMLGLTVSCARCHDHKFDPISTRDYYGLAGIFFSSHILPGPGRKTEGSPVLKIPLLSPVDLAKRQAEESRMSELESANQNLESEARKRERVSLLAESAKYLTAAAEYRNLSRSVGRAALTAVAESSVVSEETLERWLHELGFENYRFLAKTVENIHGKPGLHAWLGVQDALSVTVNTGDKELEYLTIVQPPKSIIAHPSPANAVAIAWRSPISGTVQISGEIADADNKCGDGVGWKLEFEGAGNSRALSVGEIQNGDRAPLFGADASAQSEPLTVVQGEQVILSISPRGSHSCDSTVIRLRIQSTPNADLFWELAEDLVTNPLAANPSPDRQGNADVWRLLESTETGTGGPTAGATLLREWEREIGALCLEQPTASATTTVPAAAQQIQNRLVALAVLSATDQAAHADETGKQILSRLLSEGSPFDPPFDESLLTDAEKNTWVANKTELQTLSAIPRPPLEYAVGVQEGGVPDTEHAGIRDVHVHLRGRYDKLGDVVPRGFPVVLASEPQPPIGETSGRLELAKWIGSASNPLTARVMVNRIWQHHFGEGIVRTPGNFGQLGERPTHPELLDWLASEFIRLGWSVKDIHRLILNSAVYQQSPRTAPQSYRIDPDNRYLGRMNRRRLDAESIRDAMLEVTGQLDRTIGGAPFSGLEPPRRTLYFKTVRSDRTTYKMLFDAADPTAIIDKRLDTTVAPQALFLLNNPFVLTMAEALSKRILAERNEPVDRVRLAYSILYGRAPSEAEIEIGTEAIGTGEALADWTSYAQVLLCANEFVYVD